MESIKADFDKEHEELPKEERPALTLDYPDVAKFLDQDSGLKIKRLTLKVKVIPEVVSARDINSCSKINKVKKEEKKDSKK